jgi:hypothetical protein
MKRKNEEGNKIFVWNKWDSQMSHAYPQLKKDIYVLNIIIQNILGKKKSEGNGPQKNTQNPNAFS